MVDRSLRLTALDTNHIVLDIGMTYTKCGFSKDSMPMHIVPTPLTMVQQIRDNCSKLNTCSFADAFQNKKKLMMELEEFLTYIFYHLLQTNPREKAIIICESLMTPRPLTESIGHILFRNFGVKSLYFFLTNMLPMYASGQDTGIVVECGFQNVQILPIVKSRICIEGFEVCYSGGIHIEKELNSNIVVDNKELIKLNGADEKFNFPSHVLEDLKVLSYSLNKFVKYLGPVIVSYVKRLIRTVYVIFREYRQNEKEKIQYGYTTMEYCFGNPDDEEPNIAYSILQSIKKVKCTYNFNIGTLQLNLDNRGRAVQNIILSGGSSMIPGFKKRLNQEIKHIIQTRDEFEQLREIADLIVISESCFPPNCIVWVGASLLSSLNNEIDRFLITHEEYCEKYNQEVIPDRYGEAFLFGTRQEMYFNRDFEESLRVQKQILYSNTTPYSARSLNSKREPIALMLKKSLAKMGES